MTATDGEIKRHYEMINALEEITAVKKEEIKTMQELNRTLVQILGQLKVR